MFEWRENIEELNENLTPFPKVEDIFVKEQAWLREHFLPLISIDLGELNPDWKGTKVHLLNPFEPYDGYIGEETQDFHNEFTGENYLAFRLSEDNRYEFLGNEGYFLRTAQNDWDFHCKVEAEFQKMKEKFAENIENFKKYGNLVNPNYPEYDGKPNFVNYLDNLGGEIWYGNWTESVELPSAFAMNIEQDDVKITHKGNPFYHIASVAGYNYCTNGADAILLMYEPVSRVVLFTFDYS